MLSRATRSTSREAGEVAAVGAPLLTAPRIDRLRQIAPAWMLRTAEDAARELQASSSADAARTTTVLAGPGATEPAVREAIGRATVLHIAAPFRINAASPLFSSVLLTAPERAAAGAAVTAPGDAPVGAPRPAAAVDPANDGALELREVMNVSATARAGAADRRRGDVDARQRGGDRRRAVGMAGGWRSDDGDRALVGSAGVARSVAGRVPQAPARRGAGRRRVGRGAASDPLHSRDRGARSLGRLDAARRHALTRTYRRSADPASAGSCRSWSAEATASGCQLRKLRPSAVRRRRKPPLSSTRAADRRRPRTIGEEIPPSRDLDDVLCRADAGHRVQAGVERPADHAFPPHRRHDRRRRDRRAEDRNGARHAPREPGGAPTGQIDCR